MEFLEKIFNAGSQESAEDDQTVHILKHILNGTSQNGPALFYHLVDICQNSQNANKVMHNIINLIDDYCENPAKIHKAVNLLILLLKLSEKTFPQAARNYLPEIQTLVHVSFDKPGAPHVNTIHKNANLIYLHLMKNQPLPDVKIPPRPPTQPKPQQHDLRTPEQQRMAAKHQAGNGRSRLNEEEGSLFDGNNLYDDNTPQKYDDSGSFMSGFMDLGPKRRQPVNQNQQQHHQDQNSHPSSASKLPEQDRPRMPAVFSNAGAFLGGRSRISQPLDYGNDSDTRIQDPGMGDAGESLLNFDDPIDDFNEPANTIDQTQFVFTTPEQPAAQNPTTIDFDAPFTPFGENENELKEKPVSHRPFMTSGPKPKFDPTKMKKKTKVVANTVPQDDFDPFGTGSSISVFDELAKQPQPEAPKPTKKPSLAERYSQPNTSSTQTQEPQQSKAPQQKGQNVFDLLGISGSESDDDNNPQPASNDNQNKEFGMFGQDAFASVSIPIKKESSNQLEKAQPKSSNNVFDMLGDDDIMPISNQEPASLQQHTNSTNDFDAFDQQQPKSANAFDMLGDDDLMPISNQEPISSQPQSPADSSKALDIFDNQQQPKLANVFDMLGDDLGSNSPTNQPIHSQNSTDIFSTPSGNNFIPTFDDNSFGQTPKTISPHQSPASSANVFDMLDAPSATPPQQKSPASSANVFDMLGDNTFVSNSPSTQQPKSANAFDMLDNSTPIKSPQHNQFDILGNNDFFSPTQNPQTNQSDNMLNMFSTQKTNDSNEFNPFGNTPQSASPKQNMNALKSSGNVFDMLDNSAFNATPSPSQKQKQSSPYDIFASQPATQSPKTPPTPDVFDMLGSASPSQSQNPKQQPKKSNDIFDSFNPF